MRSHSMQQRKAGAVALADAGKIDLDRWAR